MKSSHGTVQSEGSSHKVTWNLGFTWSMLMETVEESILRPWELHPFSGLGRFCAEPRKDKGTLSTSGMGHVCLEVGRGKENLLGKCSSPEGEQQACSSPAGRTKHLGRGSTLRPWEKMHGSCSMEWGCGLALLISTSLWPLQTWMSATRAKQL